MEGFGTAQYKTGWRIIKTTKDGKEKHLKVDDLIVYIQMFLLKQKEWKEAMIATRQR